MKVSTRSWLAPILAAGVAFGAGWLVRDRQAVRDEALHDRLDLLSRTFSSVGSDRLVLVMLEKQRADQLTASLAKRMADDFVHARKTLSQLPGSTTVLVERYPWAGNLLPNWAGEFKRSADYLAKHGEYPQAVQDALWLVAQVGGPGGS